MGPTDSMWLLDWMVMVCGSRLRQSIYVIALVIVPVPVPYLSSLAVAVAHALDPMAWCGTEGRVWMRVRCVCPPIAR